MPRFANATGYLLELRHNIGFQWFNAVCDMAMQSSGQQPTQDQLQILWDILHGTQTYLPVAVIPLPIQATQNTLTQNTFLHELSGFTSFKKLSPSLNLILNKQVSLVFGKNGSGKSSLCQAFKVLANPEAPREPLHNVRVQGSSSPSFSYRFNTNASPSTWIVGTGFGLHAQSIKYFDSTIAFKHATGSVNPEAAVEISVFRLETFGYARTFVNAFQVYASNLIETQKQRISEKIANAKTKLQSSVNVNAEPFVSWTPQNSSYFSTWLHNLPAFDETKEAELATLTTNLSQYTSASSKDGIQTLRAQLTLLEVLEKNLSEIYAVCRQAPLAFLQMQENTLQQKQAAAIELSREIFIPGIDPMNQHSLIASASTLIDFTTATEGHTCPLCHQQIDQKAEKLFRKYHLHLTSLLQLEIKALNDTLLGSKKYEKIRSFSLGDYTAYQSTLPEGFFDSLKTSIIVLQHATPEPEAALSTGDVAAFSEWNKLESYLQTISGIKGNIAEIIKKSTFDKEFIEAEIKRIQEQIASLNAHKIVVENRQDLLAISQEANEFTPFFLRINQIDFSSILRQLTIKGKEAHNDLILGTFEERLNEEYQALCGMTLTQMGVRLASRASQQEVIITPQVGVGDNPVHRVLSEGEQKIHSLAVFMCEATAHPYQILVFDDPVTSFDYNYVSNFCERLRDLIRSQPQTQIIVLTHNWDFFANLQSILNRSGLTNSLSVQVLEDCSVVDEYTEKWDELCQNIETIVSTSVEPTPEQKERVSGLLRRLIERLTNAYVFNEQRHQYKVKTLQISNFDLFTKIVPLLRHEADRLRDLYANLSPTEHDDIRNYYSTKNRTQFQTWYTEIVSIKNAVESRKPT